MAPSVGQQLEQARQARGLSIEEAAQATRIRPHYIRALEADDAASLPSAVQGRGFLRNYASFLGLDFAVLTGARLPASPELSPEPPASDIPGGDEAVPAVEIPPELPSVLPAVANPEPIPRRPASKNGHKPAPRPAVPIPPPAGADSLPIPRTHIIFKEIGAQLKAQRERLSLPLGDIEQYTHIRQHYLQAMESGDFGLLPSFTQARGMLNHYARFLSLDTDNILTRFAEALITRREEIMGPQAGPKQSPLRTAGRLRRFLTMDAVVGSGLVILLVIFVIWGASRVFDLKDTPQSEVTPPSVAEMLLSSPEASPTSLLDASVTPTGAENAAVTVQETPLPPDVSAAGQAGPPPLEPGKIQVFIVGLNRAWMQVSVDGKPDFTGRVVAGGAYAFTADNRIELITGNGAAIQVYFNQNDLGTPGAWNEVVHLVYTAEGALLPTPTITPTPTRTPRTSPTPTATGTISPGGE